jgi:hypothetical protein
MTTTVVTAFYPIKSKFPLPVYMQWASTFMKMEAPIVLYTDPQYESVFKAMRGDKPIHIIRQPFNECFMWTKYAGAWIHHHALDHEANIHSPQLYAVWANKASWVKEAIEVNPFGTSFFFWCDIGAFREPQWMAPHFPQSKHFPSDAVLFSSVDRCVPDDYVKRADGIIGDFKHVNRIVGGLWGGSIVACIRWATAFESQLTKYFAAGRFAGKDQSVMLSALLEDPTLGVVVKPSLAVNPWFFLQYLLSDCDAAFTVDETYTSPTKEPKQTVTVQIMGGLGNQLFQIAAAYAHARRFNATLRLERHKREADGRDTYWDSLLENVEPYLTEEKLAGLVRFQEPCGATQYVSLPPPQGVGQELFGYFQSSKYFNDYAPDIFNLFFSERYHAAALKKYAHILHDVERAVVVHARRTDYLKNDWNIAVHGPLTYDYYNKAMMHYIGKIKNPHFILFSDDPSYWDVLKLPHLQDTAFTVVTEQDPTLALMLMSEFMNFILANSTFSWWGAWFSSQRTQKKQSVIAPARWFGPAGPHIYEDIYESSWIRM